MFRFDSRVIRHIMVAGLLSLYHLTAFSGVLDETVAHPPIPLLTEEGDHVLGSGKPYSPKTSCAGSGCHDYDSITHAYHIEQGRDEARDDYGEDHDQPHLFSPGYFGGYNCMGGSNPDITAMKENASVDEFADLGTPDLVMRCTRCHSGGGWMEKDRNGRRYDQVNPETVPHLDGDYYSRSVDESGEAVVEQWDWQASGVAENDCLMCHVKVDEMVSYDSRLTDEQTPFNHAMYTRSALIRGGHFRYGATGILEFLNLNMDAESEQNLPLVSFSRDDSDGDEDGELEASDLTMGSDDLPLIEWNPDAFDAQGLTTIPMVRYPGNDNCMYCHLTSNSRRGFYGFGEGAEAVFDEAGLHVKDYQDDVHKGLTWTEANGESRNIENCNACHARNYYNESFGYQADLNADHNFLKGNSDMDLGNDRDYEPPAKSCLYCHEQAETPAIPSGHADMLTAHRERWKLAGDMTGYTEDSLNRITQTHLDALACEACHITDKESRGTPLQIMYRYSTMEDGNLKIRPYNARYRGQWIDKTSGHIFNKTERNSIYKMETDDEGNRVGLMIDPVSGETIGNVDVRMSHGSWRFTDPEDYEGITAQKGAYDNLLRSKGYEDPNAVLVWGASNFYVLSHNTRPATESVQCEECHERTARGAFSSLISTSGVLGESNSKTVASLDRRLIDEGIVEMAFPSMKADEQGEITENTSDVLYYSALNPSLSRLGTAIAPVFTGTMKDIAGESGMGGIGLNGDEISQMQGLMPASGNIYLFKPRYGDQMVRDTAVMAEKNHQAETVLSNYRFLIRLEDGESVVDAAAQAGRLRLSQVYRIEATNGDGESVSQFPGTPLFIKLPWTGSNDQALTVISSQNGESWSDLQAEQIIVAHPATEELDGYVVVRTDHLSYFAVAERSQTVAGSSGDSAGGSGGGGGGALLVLPLMLLAGLWSAWRKRLSGH
jgi:hypothetical protein